MVTSFTCETKGILMANSCLFKYLHLMARNLALVGRGAGVRV